MLKQKIHNWAKRALLVAILATTLNISFQEQTAYAAACGANPQEPVCTLAVPAGTDPTTITCPNLYTKTNSQPNEVTCTSNAELKDRGQEYRINSEKLRDNINFFKMIGDFLNRLLWPILALIGGLLDNSLLFGNGMEARLREIWIVVRNLVNIFFVLVLLGIALYNVLGLGEDGDNYSVKAALPKIVIALVAVNFSFLAIKVFLDFVNVVTTAVFAIPDQVSEETSAINLNLEVQEQLCAKFSGLSVDQLKKISLNPDSLAQKERTTAYLQVASDFEKEGAFARPLTKEDNTIEKIDGQLKPNFRERFDKAVDLKLTGRLCDGNKLSEEGQKYFEKYNQKNAAFAMAVALGNVALYDTADYKNLVNLNWDEIDKLAVSSLFAIVLYFVYAASFIALFIVLLGRLVFMWISIAASPVLLLLLASPELKGASGKIGEYVDQFVKHAVAPILIGFVLSVGWIMTSTLRNINNVSQGHFMDINMGGLPVAGLNTLQDVMIAAVTVAVIWVGVFAAADGTVTASMTNWIKEKIGGAAKWAATVPLKHTPFIPIRLGSGEETNVSVGDVGEAITDKIQRASRPDPNKVQSLLQDRIVTNVEPEPDAREMRSIRSSQDLLKHFNKAYDVKGYINPDHLKQFKAISDRDKQTILGQLKQTGNQKDRELHDVLLKLEKAENENDFKKLSEEIGRIRHPDIIKETSPETKAPVAPVATVLKAVSIENNTKIGSDDFTEHFPVVDETVVADQVAKRNTEQSQFQDQINRLAHAINANEIDENKLKPIGEKLKVKGWNADGSDKDVAPTKDELKDLLNKATTGLGDKLTDEVFKKLGL